MAQNNMSGFFTLQITEPLYILPVIQYKAVLKTTLPAPTKWSFFFSQYFIDCNYSDFVVYQSHKC